MTLCFVYRCAPPSHAFVPTVPTDDGAGDVVTYAGDVVNDVRVRLFQSSYTHGQLV